MFTSQKAVKTVSFMIFATLTAKILGMFRDIFLANYYGTGTEAIAFLSASRIPLLFFDIGLGAAISSTFIPVFNEYLEKKDKKEAIIFSNNFINIVLIITLLFTLVGNIFADQFVSIIAKGLDNEAHVLCVQLLKILFPMIVFAGMAFSLVGILQSFGEFNIPASISLVSNVIIILYFIFLNKHFGIFGLAVTMLIAWSSQVLVQIPALKSKGFKYKFIINFKSEGIKKVGLAVLPILVSTWILPINTMVNLYLASYLNNGAAFPALEYAYKLYIIVVGVFTYAVSNLVFPTLSRLDAGKANADFTKLLKKVIRIVIFVITPLMIGFIVCRVPLVKFVYERGEFGQISTNLTSTALLFYSMGMIGFALYEILNKAYYAMQNPKTPMRIAAASIVLNIILSFSFVRVFGLGLGGLALAASISAYFTAILLFINIKKRLTQLIDKRFYLFATKIFICSTIMGLLVFKLNSIINIGDSLINKFITIVVLGLSGVIIYIILTLLLKIEETYEGFDMLKKKIKGD